MNKIVVVDYLQILSLRTHLRMQNSDESSIHKSHANIQIHAIICPSCRKKSVTGHATST